MSDLHALCNDDESDCPDLHALCDDESDCPDLHALCNDDEGAHDDATDCVDLGSLCNDDLASSQAGSDNLGFFGAPMDVGAVLSSHSQAVDEDVGLAADFMDDFDEDFHPMIHGSDSPPMDLAELDALNTSDSLDLPKAEEHSFSRWKRKCDVLE